LRGPNFLAAHGDFTDPAAFDYIHDATAAAANFAATEEPLLFVGHSHRPGIFVTGASGAAHWVEPASFEMEEGKRYAVNVGSVGYSRNGDPRACFIVYDDGIDGTATASRLAAEGTATASRLAAATIEFIFVPYDFEALRAAAQHAGLTEEDYPLLSKSPADAVSSVREGIDFAASETRASGDTSAQSLDDALRLLRTHAASASRWKKFAIAAVALALLIIGGGTAAHFRLRARPAAFPAHRVTYANTYAAADNLLPPLSLRGNNASPFRILLSDRRCQTLTATNSLPRITNAKPSAATLETPDIPLAVIAPNAPAINLEFFVKFRRAEDFEGDVYLIVRYKIDGKEKIETKHITTQPRDRDETLPPTLRGFPYSDGWVLARTTQDIPTTATLRAELTAEFTGTLEIAGIAIRPKPKR
jgi:diadenosine tetraphosphatase ApaH/serine/threonine PP2A family protein phosphatase